MQSAMERASRSPARRAATRRYNDCINHEEIESPAMKTRHNRRRIALLLAALVMFAAGASETPAAQETAAVKSAAEDTPEAHLGKGYDALKQDRYDDAATEFRAALRLDPTLAKRARFPLAVALFELHKASEARAEFEALRHDVGDHPNILYYLGRLDLEDRNFEGAIRNLNQAIAKPPFPDTAYYLGFAYFKKDNLPAAEKWLKEAAKLTPRDSRVQYQLGLVYRNEGRQEEAKKALDLSRQFRQRDDNDSKLRMECAQKLEQASRQEAHAVCAQLYDPDDAEKLTALGTLYGQHGDLEAALKPLRRAAELAPQSPQMRYNLALVYFQLNQFEQARAHLADALKRWPDLFQLNALYGSVLLKLGELPAAYQALLHAHELNAQDSGTADLLYATTLDLAHKAQDAKQYSEALRYLEQGARLKPDQPGPHQSMAEIYTHTGHPAQAAAEQQEADRLTNTPDRPQ